MNLTDSPQKSFYFVTNSSPYSFTTNLCRLLLLQVLKINFKTITGLYWDVIQIEEVFEFQLSTLSIQYILRRDDNMMVRKVRGFWHWVPRSGWGLLCMAWFVHNRATVNPFVSYYDNEALHNHREGGRKPGWERTRHGRPTSETIQIRPSSISSMKFCPCLNEWPAKSKEQLHE